MNDKYEAAELLVVGNAKDVILGTKDVKVIDTRQEPPLDYQDSSLALFEE